MTPLNPRSSNICRSEPRSSSSSRIDSRSSGSMSGTIAVIVTPGTPDGFPSPLAVRRKRIDQAVVDVSAPGVGPDPRRIEDDCVDDSLVPLQLRARLLWRAVDRIRLGHLIG